MPRGKGKRAPRDNGTCPLRGSLEALPGPNPRYWSRDGELFSASLNCVTKSEVTGKGEGLKPPCEFPVATEK